MTGIDKIRKALQLQGAAPLAAHAHASAVAPVLQATSERVAVMRERHDDAREPRPELRPEPRRSPSPRKIAVDAVALRARRVVLPGDTGAAAESYKMLRTQVLQMMRKKGFSSLAVVSPTAADGRTLTAVNLAASIADDPDHTALLVDLDLRRPGVSGLFDVAVERGVDACLTDSTLDVAELLQQPEGFRKLLLLPAARPVAGSSELLAAESTRRITREINARYTNRIVLYDLPPLLETADGLAFLRCVDAALLVVREGATRRDDVARALHMIRDTPVVGTVLNASRPPRGG